ncbi:MAG: protein-L-isoaspartate O-methyltransferase family protein [Burkholderiaceae bacterium]
MNIEQARFNMIEQQIRPWDVLDAGVLGLLAKVRREDFVPPAHRALAFSDTEIALPEGQRMLAPRVEARLLQELRLTGTERTLEIGAGSGFMACLLGHQSREVTTLEIHASLVEMARGHLARARLAHVQVVHADGSLPESVDGEFDAIVLSGSVALEPVALKSRLRIGGRLVAIVGTEPVMRAVRYTRVAESAWEQTILFDTAAPALQGFPMPSRFHF